LRVLVHRFAGLALHPPSACTCANGPAVNLSSYLPFQKQTVNCGDAVTRPGGLTGYLLFFPAFIRTRFLSLYGFVIPGPIGTEELS
jgi:hypothetical protein